MKIPTLIAAMCMMMGGGHAKTPAAIAAIAGDYVEVRTASVFAGACHYNGELVTTGRDALLAMNIASGEWEGTDLAGVRIAAETTSNENLGNADAARKTEVMIDSAASEKQARAAVEMLKTKYHDALGEISGVRRGTVLFTHRGDTYSVNAPGLGAWQVDGMPNHECCKQPNLVWYSPLVGVKDRMVGYTVSASYCGGVNGDSWTRGDENGAFYGKLGS